jgi:hypothetical protein
MKKNKFDSWNLEKKIVKLASKYTIFEVFGTERGISQFFMMDSFFKTRNTHSDQIPYF